MPGNQKSDASLSQAINEIDSVEVRYKGRTVGKLAQTPEGALAFQYDNDWLIDGFSISPLSLPLDNKVYVANMRPLNGVFGVFADSIPDGWGKLLVDRTLRRRGVDPSAVSPLSRLAIVGNSGMGALTYHPEVKIESGIVHENLDKLASMCAEVLSTDYDDDLDTLFRLGGSSGGARPKILTEIDGRDWIIKFPSSVDSSTIGKEEYELAMVAKGCSISFGEVELFPSKTCEGYFGTLRFDRSYDAEGSKTPIHMISAAALLETSHRIPNLDYEHLFRLVLTVSNDVEDMKQLFKQMVFNAYVGNRDDHSKNFSFLYDESEKRYMLSPAYDITTNEGINGEHATTINGKGRDFAVGDFTDLGKRMGLSAAWMNKTVSLIREIIEESINEGREDF